MFKLQRQEGAYPCWVVDRAQPESLPLVFTHLLLVSLIQYSFWGARSAVERVGDQRSVSFHYLCFLLFLLHCGLQRGPTALVFTLRK